MERTEVIYARMDNGYAFSQAAQSFCLYDQYFLPRIFKPTQRKFSISVYQIIDILQSLVYTEKDVE